MAELTIEQLNQSGPNTKCVILAQWAYTALPAQLFGTKELAMGGHLATHLECLLRRRRSVW